MVIYYLLQPSEEHHMKLHFHSQKDLLSFLMHSWKGSNYHPLQFTEQIHKLVSNQYCKLSIHHSRHNHSCFLSRFWLIPHLCCHQYFCHCSCTSSVRLNLMSLKQCKGYVFLVMNKNGHTDTGQGYPMGVSVISSHVYTEKIKKI